MYIINAWPFVRRGKLIWIRANVRGTKCEATTLIPDVELSVEVREIN